MFFARIKPLEPKVPTLSLEEAVMNYSFYDHVLDMRPTIIPGKVYPVPVPRGGLLFFMKREVPDGIALEAQDARVD